MLDDVISIPNPLSNTSFKNENLSSGAMVTLNDIKSIMINKCDRVISFLLWGPNGCGKTFLISTLARNVNAKLNTHEMNKVDSLVEFKQKIESVIDDSCRGLKNFLFFKNIDDLENNNNCFNLCLCSIIKSLLSSNQNNFRNHLHIFASAQNIATVKLRFLHEIFVGLPNKIERTQLYENIVKKICNEDECSKDEITKYLNDLGLRSGGMSGEDIIQFTRNGVVDYFCNKQIGIHDLQIDTDRLKVGVFLKILVKNISMLKHGDTCIDLDDSVLVGGYDEEKQQLIQSLCWPLWYSDVFKKFSLMGDHGVLLHGPPGCGKTSLVRLVANMAKMNFFSLSSAQLYSTYLGDSERKINEVFLQALSCSPAIVFIDEIDSVVGSRQVGGGGSVQERVLTSLLNHMDGIGHKAHLMNKSWSQNSLQQFPEEGRVVVVATTNRLDLLDGALLRRFDRLIHIGPPSLKMRIDILKLYTRNLPVQQALDLDRLAQHTKNFTGADLENLCKQASLHALNRFDNLDDLYVDDNNFLSILRNMKPSNFQQFY